MDSVTMIRVVAGVLFVVVLFILIQRRKGRATRG
jgi:preprotein translocase subunit SecG